MDAFPASAGPPSLPNNNCCSLQRGSAFCIPMHRLAVFTAQDKWHFRVRNSALEKTRRRIVVVFCHVNCNKKGVPVVLNEAQAANLTTQSVKKLKALKVFSIKEFFTQHRVCTCKKGSSVALTVSCHGASLYDYEDFHKRDRKIFL